jgi:parallel beta-helix repeat protein
MELTRCSTLRGMLRLVVVCAPAMLAVAARAATINVGPGQAYTTIQSGINAANNGDTVLVAPGTYYENIDFLGKAITVTSSGGSAVTIIDGGGAPGKATVSFQTNELRDSVISNFTIRNGGYATFTSESNAGVYALLSAPTITNNIITANQCDGVYLQVSAASVSNNEINQSLQPTALPNYCSFPGYGVVVYGSSAIGPYAEVSIIGNTIEDNNCDSECGGIELWGGTALIQGNTIRNNISFSGGLPDLLNQIVC